MDERVERMMRKLEKLTPENLILAMILFADLKDSQENHPGEPDSPEKAP